MQNNYLTQAFASLLMPTKLDEECVVKILSHISAKQIDFADLYFQLTYCESWVLEDSIVKNVNYDIDRGVGVRVIQDDKTGFAYAQELTFDAIMHAASCATSIFNNSTQKSNLVFIRQAGLNNLYGAINPLKSLEDAKKVKLLQDIDCYLRQKDARIKQVNVNLASSYSTVLIAATDNTLAADVRPLMRFNVSVIIEENGKREQGASGGGGRFCYEHFLNSKDAYNYADQALSQALINLSATQAPAGIMPVVLGPGWPGVLLHEAIGHGLEGDFNRRGSSAFTNKIGQQVAAKSCTIVDNGTLEGRRGSLNIDDEGTPTQNTVLIKDGILQGYMQDKLNARLMQTKTTGNGRRQSYASLPLPRMTNTYMLPGKNSKDEIIASVDKGLYAVNFSGGQVDITSGKFVFSSSEAYLIEKGKITHPVKNATLIGSGPDILMRVSLIGDDLMLDSGVGVCGKDGQSVPVGVGQPTVRVDEITVGGTK